MARCWMECSTSVTVGARLAGYKGKHRSAIQEEESLGWNVTVSPTIGV